VNRAFGRFLELYHINDQYFETTCKACVCFDSADVNEALNLHI
jgi:hypothetical protein